MSDYLKGKRVVDPVLTSIARGYKNAAFIGERIFPVVLTDKEGVRVPTFGKTAFVEYDTERAVGADSNVLVREKTGTLDLVLGEHDLAAPVDYREQAESMFNEESKAIRRATNGVNLRRELIAARLAQDEKVYRIRYADELIDAHLRGRYILPLAEIPTVLRDIAITLVRYRLYARRPEGDLPDTVKDDHKEALRQLRELRDNRLTLGLPSTQKDVPEPGEFRVRSRPATFGGRDGLLEKY